MVNTKKLFKTALEGVVSSSLAATMLLTQLNLGVRAATTPSETKFIPKSALETTDTKFGLFTGKTVQKVYFGKNPNFNKVTGTRTTSSGSIALGSGAAAADQGWYIAGYDSTTGGLVLLCDILQPMSDTELISSTGGSNKAIGGMPFLAEANKTGSGNTGTFNVAGYSQNWGCTYQSDAPEEGSQVYANHFGGSDIWKEIKEYQDDTTRFSTAEQALMKPTTVWTWDSKNNKFYSTRSKLYLGAGQYSYNTSDDKHFFTVGANTIDTSESKTGNDAVNNGLKVGLVAATGATDSPYTIAYSNGRWFWLRSPYASYSSNALGARTGRYVDSNYVYDSYRCVPACALNLQSVIFASAAAPAAELQSSSALSDGVYLRVAEPSQGDKIKATATTSGRKVTVTKGSEGTGDEYLYIQGNDGMEDWVYSKKIEGSTTFTANEIRASATSFAGCKAWLETTEDNVTYAREIPVNGSMDTVEIVNNCNAVVELHDKDGAISNTTGISLTLKDSAGTTKVAPGAWAQEGATFTSNSTIPGGSYTLSVTWAGNTLAQSEFPVEVDGTAKTVTLTKLFPIYVQLKDDADEIMTDAANMTFTLSRDGSVVSTLWSYDATKQAFKSNTALAEGSYNLKIVLHGSALSQTQWENLTVDGETVNECSLHKTYPVYIKLKDSLGNEITGADNMKVELQKGTEDAIPLTYKASSESFEPAKNISEGTYTLTVTPPDGAAYTVEQNASEIKVVRTLEKTVTITKLCPVHVALQNEVGKAITGEDSTGITLKIGATPLSENTTTKGIFESISIPEGSYTLTVTVNEDSSNYLAPKVTTYTIENSASNPSSAAKPHRIIKLEKGFVGTGRVVTGVGGDAGYRYDRKTGKTVFYCNPAEGYKVDKIEKDSKGIVKYVSFKTL